MKKYKKIVFILLMWAGCLYSQTLNGIGDYQDYYIRSKRIIIKYDSVYVSIGFIQQNIIRFDIFPQKEDFSDTSVVVKDKLLPLDNMVLKYAPDSIKISFSGTRLSVKTKPFFIRIFNSNSNVILEGDPSGMVRLVRDSVKVVFSLKEKDHFYGFGEKCLPFDRKGYKFSMYNTQVYGYRKETSVMSINIPFFINPAGYGIYFDSYSPSFFDLGASDKEFFSFSNQDSKLSFYVIIEDDVKKILSDYTQLTGTQPMPPMWAMGYLQSKYGYKNEKEVRITVNTFRKKGIPLSAIILDLYWFGGIKNMGNLLWNRDAWPEPDSMVKDLLSAGIRTVLIEEPYINIHSKNFKEADSSSYLGFDESGRTLIDSMWAGSCAILDMTNPKASKWWWQKHIPIIQTGVAGWWTDLGEPELNPPAMNYLAGPWFKVNNIYNFFWSRNLFNGYRSDFPDKRVFILTRSGFAGMQRWSTFPWSGDVDRSFPGLACQIPIMLGMGISGAGFMHSDIGGYVGDPDPELYSRWIAFGAFSPIMRAHGVEKGVEPWFFGEETERIARRYIELRYRLMPYNYTLAYINHTKGWPLARPLVFNYPDDRNVLNMNDEYLWGDDFLIAPVLQEKTDFRDVYLPEGEWIDYWDGKIYSGSCTIKTSTPLNKIPVFIRNGAILPQITRYSFHRGVNFDTLLVDFYPKGCSEFRLYEDDGVTNEYESGKYAITLFSLREKGTMINIYVGPSIGAYLNKPDKRVYELNIHNVKIKPVFVSVNEENAAEINPEMKKYASVKWVYNRSGKLLKIFIDGRLDKSYNIRFGMENGQARRGHGNS